MRAALLALSPFPVQRDSGLICQESFLWDATVKKNPLPLKDALGGLVMQVHFERFSFNELQSSVLGHSFRTSASFLHSNAELQNGHVIRHDTFVAVDD